MSWEQLQPFMEAVITLFAIINPVYTLPIFNALTSDVTFREQKMMFRLAAAVGSATVIVVGVIGEVLMRKVFGVSLGSLEVACGVMLVVVCVKNMITDSTGRERQMPPDVTPDKRRQQLIARAVSPMACPVLIGPGSIVTAILIVNHNGLLLGLVAMAAASVLVLVVMNWGQLVTRLLGRIGSIIVARVLMIFLAAIGMEFIYRGIVQWLPGLVQFHK